MSQLTPQVLHPNISPMPIRGKSFFECFSDLTVKSTYMLITTGYISEDSIFFLKMNLNNLPPFNIVIGMSGIEGFTKSQYHGLVELNAKMIDESKGMVYVSTAFKYHGKAYSFFKDNKPIAAIVGSTNASILGDASKRQYELDVLLTDDQSMSIVIETQNDLIKFSKEICNFHPDKFLDHEVQPLLESFITSSKAKVEKLTLDELTDMQINTIFQKEIKLKLKCEQKSNMNVVFGGGRGGGDSGRGRLIPRSWLEFEVIVASDIYKQPGYPAGQSFWVVTDDGWSFICSTQGGQKGDPIQGKNLRSNNDLHVLGAWVKGRLLKSGAVQFGEFITEAQLESYGRDYLSLVPTSKTKNDLKVFYIDFSVKK